jgi:two-component system alkaline phosphatase synthesis response regulator PhoP
MTKRILVVDDDPLQLKLVDAVASKAGYEVLSAPDGKSGLDRARELHPDLIIMDIMMPQMDGYTALEAIRQSNGLKKVPVIMVTAVGFDMNRKMALEMGADDYVTKPFGVKDLLERIEKLLKTGGHHA